MLADSFCQASCVKSRNNEKTDEKLSRMVREDLSAYILVPAFGFVLLTLVRKWINQPRPYETWEIIPLLDKDSSGNSMPSRHVFSATIISMACLHANLPVGLVLLVLSALLGFVRVLGGVHYPKDVLVGYACSLLLGILFFIL